MSWDIAREDLQTVPSLPATLFSRALEGWRGIAEGSGASFRRPVTLNTAQAMTLIKRPASDEEELDGCSSVAVLARGHGR